jgi:hypothetical protein
LLRFGSIFISFLVSFASLVSATKYGI